MIRLFNFKMYKCILIFATTNNKIFQLYLSFEGYLSIYCHLDSFDSFFFFFTNPESSRKLALRGVRMYELIKTGYGNFLFKCDITLVEDTSGCTNGSLVVLIRVRVSLGAIFHYNLHLWILLFRGIIIVESRAHNVFVSIFFFFESSRIDLGPKSLRFRVFLTFMFPFISNIISLLF